MISDQIFHVNLNFNMGKMINRLNPAQLSAAPGAKPEDL
jgi:hypothetical protein